MHISTIAHIGIMIWKGHHGRGAARDRCRLKIKRAQVRAIARHRFPAPSPRATATGSSPSQGDTATLTMDVDEQGGLLGGYELKLNSYDLGVDIELADAIERCASSTPR